MRTVGWNGCHTDGTQTCDDGGMQREQYAVIDVETTGFRAARDRIVEVACADRRRADRGALGHAGRPRNRDSGLRDGGPRHYRRDGQWRTAPWAGSQVLRRRCAGRVVAAHCARFDLSFVGPSVGREGLCTMLLARALFPEAPNHKNQTLRRFLDIDRAAGEEFEAHRALSDAVVSAHVLIACRRRFRARYATESWQRFARREALVVMESS